MNGLDSLHDSLRVRAEGESAETLNHFGHGLNAGTRRLVTGVQRLLLLVCSALELLHAFFVPAPAENLNQRISDVCEGKGYEQ